MSDSIQIDQPETIEQPQKKFGSNPRQVAIARLRTVALSDAEAPVERLKAAAKLRSKYLSKRNVAIIKRTVKLFINSRDPDETYGTIARRAQTLKLKLLKDLNLKIVSSVDFPEDEPTIQPLQAENTVHPQPPYPAYPGFVWRYRVLTEGGIEWQLIQKTK